MQRGRGVPGRPPKRTRGREFDLWCWEMRTRRNYACLYLAACAGVSVSAVENAVRRVEAGRYGDPEGL